MRTRESQRQHNVRQKGVTFVEVLIALTIVSIGMIGLATMQLNGMQQSASMNARDQAIVLSKDLVNRMRINPGAFPDPTGAFAYDNYDSSTPASCATYAGPVCQATDSDAAVACTSAQIATYDLYAVSCGVGTFSAEALPNGSINVTCNETPCNQNSVWTVTAGWMESGGTRSVAEQNRSRSVSMQFRP